MMMLYAENYKLLGPNSKSVVENPLERTPSHSDERHTLGNSLTHLCYVAPKNNLFVTIFRLFDSA